MKKKSFCREAEIYLLTQIYNYEEKDSSRGGCRIDGRRCGFSAYNKTNVLNVLSANVEALANDESHTTWACDGSSKTRCEVCGTSVSGRGRLTGSHKCS